MFATRNVDWEVWRLLLTVCVVLTLRAFALSKIDNRLLYLRALWLVSHAAAFGVLYLVMQSINKKKSIDEKTVLTVKVVPSMSNPNASGDEKVTVSEYDQRQLKELGTGIVIPAVIIAVLHIYWGKLTSSVLSLLVVFPCWLARSPPSFRLC